MAAPTTTLATQRPDLASLFQFDLEASWRGFIGYQLFPVMNVGRSAGNWGVLKLNHLLQKRSTARTPNSGYSRSTHKFEPRTYQTHEQGHEEPVDDNEAAMYSDYYSQEMVATARCYDAILRNAEERVKDAIYGISNSTALTTPWSTPGSATPIDDIKDAKLKVRDRIGFVPNVLQVEYANFEDLINCDQIVDRVKYQGYMDARPGEITRQACAAALNVDQIIISGESSMINTADPEATDPSLSTIWPKTSAALLVVATNNDIRQPCIGRTFHWGGTGAQNDGSRIGGTVERYRDEPVRADIVRVRHQVDEVVVYEACGEILTNTSA